MKKGLVKRILLALFWPSTLLSELVWMMMVAGEAKENRHSHGDRKMSEKSYSLEEIRKSVPEDGELEVHEKYVAIRRWALDRAGTCIWKAYKKVDEGYVEFDFSSVLNESANYLAKSITAKKIIKEVLLKITITDLMDLQERVAKKPKVTVGVQRGSCVYLYIRGKRGQPAQLQLTE